MGKILCATRGGEASYTTQDAVIALAKEQGDELVFLYVADISFLNNMSAPMVIDVESRLEKLGRFQLVMAQERAAEQGVAASTICHKGKVQEELKNAARQEDVSLVVLGQPVGEESIFQSASLKAFAAEIEAETGTPVRIL